jgi:LEA14-like dessication related protein
MIFYLRKTFSDLVSRKAREVRRESIFVSMQKFASVIDRNFVSRSPDKNRRLFKTYKNHATTQTLSSLRALRLGAQLYAVFLLTSCATTFQEPKFTGVKDLKMDKLDASGMEATVTIGVKNPNTVGFSVYRSKFDLYYDGVYLGKTKSRKRVHINANTEKNYTFRFKGSFKNVATSDLMKLVGGGGRGQVQIKGNLKVGKFFVRKKFPIDVKHRASL